MRQCTYQYVSCLLKSAVFRWFLCECFLFFNSSDAARTLFQLMGPLYANACCPYDFVLAAATLRIFESDDERSGLADVYTFKSSDRYFGYAVVSAVWHRESIL